MKMLVVALALVLAVTVTGCSNGTVAEPVEPVVVELLVRGALPPVDEAFVVGQAVRVKDSGAVIGTITDVAVEPALMAVPDATGSLQAARSPVFLDIWLTIEGEASVSDAGYRFDGTNVYVNSDIEYLTPVTFFSGTIMSMKPVDAGQ
jgi:hypothetical protein